MKNRSLSAIALMALGLLLIAGVIVIIFYIPQGSTGPANGNLPTEETFPEIQRVSLADAKAAYDLKSAVFVDARDGVSYQAQHIPGAVSIPVQDLPSRLKELDSSRWIITYCT